MGCASGGCAATPLHPWIFFCPCPENTLGGASTDAKSLLLAALTGLGTAASVQAQGYNNFRVPQNQAAFNAGATLGSAVGARAGFQAGAINTPYYAAGVYPTIQDPANGYLTGAASVISAQSQFMLSTEQAKLTREDVRRSRLGVRAGTCRAVQESAPSAARDHRPAVRARSDRR